MLMHSKRQLLNQRGDTIVEVLISIAVVSMILGGAFVLTNRSLQATRGAQERGNAMKVIEAQLESVKSIAGGENSNDVMGAGVPSPFCIAPSNLAVVTTTGNNCKFNSLGNNNNGSSEPVFNVAITRTAVNGGEGYTFTITNTWNSITAKSGAAQERATMSYRIYKP
jgi:type II secretory pathway pseudopilin PulG